MAQAAKRHSTTRRSMLAGIAAAIVATPAVAADPIGALIEQDDPIFAAIEAHRRAYDAWLHIVYFGTEPKDGEWVEYNEAWEKSEVLADQLLEVQPTTVAGAMALLRYWNDSQYHADGSRDQHWPEDDYEDEDEGLPGRRSFGFVLVNNVVKALEALTNTNQAA